MATARTRSGRKAQLLGTMQDKFIFPLGLLGAALALVLCGQALAGAFEGTTAAHRRVGLAERGDVRAQFELAIFNYYGQDGSPVYTEAAKWFRKAAEQGDMEAQRYLGFMYANGQGVARNDKEAVKWYGRAAEQGDADAQVNLGVMYSAARGTSQNLVQAHKWFSVAASDYSLSDRGKREEAMKNSERLAAKMSPDQIAEARRLAREWQPKT